MGPENKSTPICSLPHLDLRNAHWPITLPGNPWKAFQLQALQSLSVQLAEQNSHDFRRHVLDFRQVGAMDLRWQLHFTHRIAPLQDCGGHEDVNAILLHLGRPCVCQKGFRRPAAEAKVSADGLAEIVAKRRTHAGVDHHVGDVAIQAVPQIARRGKVKVHGTAEGPDPLGRHRLQVGVDAKAMLGIDLATFRQCGIERTPKRVPDMDLKIPIGCTILLNMVGIDSLRLEHTLPLPGTMNHRRGWHDSEFGSP